MVGWRTLGDLIPSTVREPWEMVEFTDVLQRAARASELTHHTPQAEEYCTNVGADDPRLEWAASMAQGLEEDFIFWCRELNISPPWWG